MSFKYRFILSFVLLEIIFITLIVTMNFVAINNSSNKLINEKIESNISFMEELLKIPISIYDLATIDNLLVKSQKLKYINSIAILDAQDNLLADAYSFKHIKKDELIKTKKNFTYELENEVYEVRYKEIVEEGVNLGSLYLIFDTSDNKQFIEKNKMNTISIIAVEILISTILSYLIGAKLTAMLTSLSETARLIGENKDTTIPYLDKKNEIGILSNSLNQMHIDLKSRNNKLKELAIELNTQKNELIEAHKSKDDFLANMSHELKTPLNSINVISSVMMKNKKGSLDDSQVKNLSIINNCGKDLLYLINDVLDISKLEAGEIKISASTFNVYDVLIELYDMFKAQVNEKGLDLVFDCDKNIGFIHNDINRLKQVVKNLLSNSVKFTSSGEIKIIAKNKDDYLEIYVKDQGIGIENDKLDHVFDRFKQADSSTTRKYGGTGLGLAISKELAKLMGGDIEVKSKIGEGSIFKVSILRNEQNIQKIEKTIKKEVSNESSDTVKSKKLLFLNNDPLSFLSIVVALQKETNVSQVSNIAELIKKAKSEEFDYIILDVSDMESNILEKVVILNSNLVFLLSDENSLHDDIKNKAQVVLNKPIDKDKLLSIVKG